jgi:hypothetical protein
MLDSVAAMSCGAAAMSCGAAAMNCDAAAMPGIVAVMSLHPMQMRLCLVRKTTGVAAGVVRQSVTLSSRLKSIQPDGFSAGRFFNRGENVGLLAIAGAKDPSR